MHLRGLQIDPHTHMSLLLPQRRLATRLHTPLQQKTSSTVSEKLLNYLDLSHCAATGVTGKTLDENQVIYYRIYKETHSITILTNLKRLQAQQATSSDAHSHIYHYWAINSHQGEIRLWYETRKPFWIGFFLFSQACEIAGHWKTFRVNNTQEFTHSLDKFCVINSDM